MRQELTCTSLVQVFAEMDTDYSGFLSRDEIAQLLEKVYGDGTHLTRLLLTLFHCPLKWETCASLLPSGT